MAEDSHPSTPPPLSPTTEDDQVLWLRLLRSRRVGIATFYRLLREYRSAAGALAALPDIARAAGIDNYQPCPTGIAEAELRAARKAGARMICIGAPDYPSTLSTITDAPPILWTIGDITILQRPMIAMVGARNASSLGTRMARALAGGLADQGYVIVSGLAQGIDAAAHQASLESGTIAVQAGGVDGIYPAENTTLAVEIAKSGLRLSEQPMGIAPMAHHFPPRNRIISGLAQGVIVVEAAAKSGSLITARDALDQGREVMAVPGHPFDARAAGCNMLIRDGAHLVRSATDVIEALGQPEMKPAAQERPDIPAPAPQKRNLKQTADLHSQILRRLGPSPLAEDQLIRDLAMAAHDVSPVLVDLELDGRITRQPGGFLALVT